MSETKIKLFCHTLYYCHTNTPFCHTEGVARSIQKGDLQGNAICLDSSLSTKAQNDKVLDSCNDNTICHTPFSFCHTERSEVSKNKGVELQSNAVCLDFVFLDTSGYALSMTGKITV